MPPFGPIGRADLIRALRKAGYEGPLPGRKHQVMRRNGGRVRLPNPHRGDVSTNLLFRLPRDAGISREEWENL
jgi:hypothetical protein